MRRRTPARRARGARAQEQNKPQELTATRRPSRAATSEWDPLSGAYKAAQEAQTQSRRSADGEHIPKQKDTRLTPRAKTPRSLPRSIPPPKSPGNERTGGIESRQSPEPLPKERHVGWSLLPWRLIPLDLGPPRLTRPTRFFLKTWDIRLRRYTSPREAWTAPPLLSPLPASPTRSVTRETQTLPPSRVHRGVQAAPPSGVDQASQSDSDWEPTTSVSSTQTDPEDTARSTATTTELKPSSRQPSPRPKASSTRSRKTPQHELKPSSRAPSTQPKAASTGHRRPSKTARYEQWGPLQQTRSTPSITWSERLPR
ncbi:serine/arginine repetitive matrix protein 1-like [Polyergus mexicanus]|uniref:serine/arginine repetitive matrix protein 1-like n=1 Tax=Polyergus mexicanus TaxID=615972 RepID=UPI0038B56099